MCCEEKCLKRWNIFYVVFFLLVSISEILFGTYCYIYMTMTNKEVTITNFNITTPSLVLILIGIVLFALTLLGCCGFIKEITFCINSYSFILLLIAVIQILNGIFAFLNVSDNSGLLKEIKDNLNHSMRWYEKEWVFLDNVQTLIHCCGVNSPIEWNVTCIPNSCCGDREPECCNLNSEFLYGSGCSKELYNFVSLLNLIVGYSSISFGFVQIFAAVGGCCLGYFYYRQNSYSSYDF